LRVGKGAFTVLKFEECCGELGVIA
jgi:hypothetical protein